MAVGHIKFRIILCGEYGSGKTSIFRHFIGARFEPSNEPVRSKGLDHSSRTFQYNGKDITVSGSFE